MAPATLSNAEWAGWVQEAADHAAANGSRSCDTFRRAARAIRLHNEPFHHPSQALALNGVGEGVVRLITSRLQDKCNATGDPFPTEPPKQKRRRNASNQTRPRKRAHETLTAEERVLDSYSSDDQNQPPPLSNPTQSSARQKKKTKPRRGKNDGLTAAERALDDPSSEPGPEPMTNASKRPKSRTTRSYIPKRRTGCYGILIAMSVLTAESTGSFAKPEIIQLAQEYCDSSYTERAGRGGGAGNSGHYTAWNMKKLLTEGLSASKPGRPTKFILTQQGFEVGSILAEQEGLSLVPFDKSQLPVGAEWPVIDSKLDELNSPGNSLPIPSSSKVTGNSKKNLDKPNSRDHNPSNATTQQLNNPQRSSLPNHPINSQITCLTTDSNQTLGGLPPNRGPFEFWYLDRGGSRVRNIDDADTRMHPRTFETLYQIEFAKSQNSHPVKRSSIVNEAPVCPQAMANSNSHMIGWMYESKAIPNCPGFAPSAHSPTLPNSAILQSSGLITSASKNTSPKAPSSSLPTKRLRPPSLSRHPSVNIIHEESQCGLSTETTTEVGYWNEISPPDQLFKPSSSGATTPAGSVISIHSEADMMFEVPLPIDRLKPPSRLGSCEIMLSETALSQTVVGYGSNSPDSLSGPDSLSVSEPVGSRPSTCTLRVNPRRMSSMPSAGSKLTSIPGLPNTRSSANLQRTPSTLSESQSNRPPVDGLPGNRTVVNLKRTSSTLSESHFSGRTTSTGDFVPEVWKAGSYDICIVLDHREVRAVNDREALYNLCVSQAAVLSESHPSPIRVLQRALVIGDAIWIAVHRDNHREVVLDSIVERKRLDDLCASIKDGRFEEQKARLKRSGLRDPIYLVEAYNVQSNIDSHGQMIYTSKFETMLLNDFQLEPTADWKASVEFLMRRTEVLRDLHQTIDLSIIPDSEIDLSTYLSKLTKLRQEDGSRYWVTGYGPFEELNSKSSTLRVWQLWARMVNCLPGMSPAKVTSFVEHWPTPSQFWADVHAHTSLDSTTTGPSSSDKHPWSWIERIANSPLSPDVPAIPSTQASSSSSSATSSTTNTNTASASARIGPTLSKRLWELYTLSDYGSSTS